MEPRTPIHPILGFVFIVILAVVAFLSFKPTPQPTYKIAPQIKPPATEPFKDNCANDPKCGGKG